MPKKKHEDEGSGEITVEFEKPKYAQHWDHEKGEVARHYDKPIVIPNETATYVPPPDPEPVPVIERSILLKVSCSRAGSCCGGSNKATNRYAILTIKGNDEIGWTLIGNTRLTTNILKLAKDNQVPEKKTPWAGSVFSMGLHENDEFMRQVGACPGLIKSGCTVIK